MDVAGIEHIGDVGSRPDRRDRGVAVKKVNGQPIVLGSPLRFAARNTDRLPPAEGLGVIVEVSPDHTGGTNHEDGSFLR
jgi:hypothetical protein